MTEISYIRSFFLKILSVLAFIFILNLVFEIVLILIYESEELEKQLEKSFLDELDPQNELLKFLSSLENDKKMDMLDNLSNKTKKFIPTNEWQEINSDEPLPSGLYYRININNGKKEAKLIDPNEESTGSFVLDVAGKKKIEDQGKLIDFHENEINKINEKIKKLRSIDEIKEEFKKADLKFTTDQEIVKSLLTKYQTSNDLDEKKNILYDLEFYVHQYDVAGDFIKMDGLEILKKDFIFSENLEIKIMIATVLGSAASSNPVLKLAITKSDIIHKLIQIIDLTKNSDTDLRLVSKSLFTISALLRTFPYAQQIFIKNNGLSILKFYINLDQEIIENNKILIKCQERILNLLNDLVIEYQYAKEDYFNLEKSKSDLLEEKYKQYEDIQITKKLDEINFCQLILKNFESSSFDLKEKFFESIYICRNFCQKYYSDKLNILYSYKNEIVEKILPSVTSKIIDVEFYEEKMFKIDNLIRFIKE